MLDWQPFVFGGIASVTAECGTFPIDTTKTRLQIQGQQFCQHNRDLKYRGMLHAFLRISKEEGICALYSGLAPAVLRQATYGTIKIGIYHYLKRLFSRDFKEEKLVTNVICGITAGVISSSIANPTDVLKVRMQAKLDGFKNRSMAGAFVDIYHKEGVRGLWRGVGPTANRAAVVAGVELPIYDVLKKHLILSGMMKDNIFTHFICSSIAGLAGAIASNPIDVVKTRMMNQRKLKLSSSSLVTAAGTVQPAAVIYSSSIQCLVQTLRTEGFFALYKGFIPNWLRLGPWTVIFFVTFEQLRGLSC